MIHRPCSPPFFHLLNTVVQNLIFEFLEDRAVKFLKFFCTAQGVFRGDTSFSLFETKLLIFVL